MTRYLLSPAADADLIDIWLYTFETWNSDQADRYTGQIIDACAAIAAGKARGKRVDDVKGGYFKVPVGSHLIIHRREGDVVLVIRILHRRMDISSHLKPDE